MKKKSTKTLSLKPKCNCGRGPTMKRCGHHYPHCDTLYVQGETEPPKKKRFFFFYPLKNK